MTAAKRVKKNITLGQYHKRRIATCIAILADKIFERIVEHYNLDGTTWATVIFVILSALAFIFAGIWLYASFQNVDKEDELAKENMLKAHDNISTLFLVIFAAVIMISMFWDGTLTIKISSDQISQFWLIFWFGYLALESGFFLHQEGKLSIDEEDE